MNIDSIRDYCLKRPGATEDIQWGNDLLFRIGGKIFAAVDLGSPSSSLSFKCTPEEFAMLIELDGISPARYTARYHWFTLERSGALSEAETKKLIRKSYEMVLSKLPKKVRDEISSKRSKRIASCSA